MALEDATDYCDHVARRLICSLAGCSHTTRLLWLPPHHNTDALASYAEPCVTQGGCMALEDAVDVAAPASRTARIGAMDCRACGCRRTTMHYDERGEAHVT